MLNCRFFILLFFNFLHGCTSTPYLTNCDSGMNIEECNNIVDEVYLYSLLSVNSYETPKNTPFYLPSITEVRFEDSAVLSPSFKYIHSKVYDNGSFQAKVYEINKKTAVIAYRGTQNFLGGDMFSGSLSNKHKKLAKQLYKEIKAKYSNVTLTGHSLGGALAIAVASECTKNPIDVYVFNTSYKNIFKHKQPNSKTKIISIVESGDPLAFFRSISNEPNNIKVYKFDFTKNPIKGNHSKDNITLGLLKYAIKNNRNEEALIIYNRCKEQQCN